MLLADPEQGRLIDDDEVKSTYASRQPYGEWLDSNLVRLHDLHIPNKNVRTSLTKNLQSSRRLSAIPTRMSRQQHPSYG